MAKILNNMKKTTFLLRTCIMSVLLLIATIFTVNAQSVGDKFTNGQLTPFTSKKVTKTDLEQYALYKKNNYQTEVQWTKSNDIKEEKTTKFKSGELWYEVISVDDKQVKVAETEDKERYKGDIVIPETVEYLGTTYSVTEIGKYAMVCNITSVKVPKSIMKMGGFFSYFLTSIEVDKDNPKFSSQEGILFNKDKTELIQYPNDKVETTYTVPSSVKNIISLYSKHLTSIIIPSSVIKISDIGSASLISIIVDENNPNYSSQDGILFNKDKTELIKYPNDKVETTYTVPNSVKTIISFNSKHLTSIIIPSSVIKIKEDYPFDYCTALVSIKIDANNPSYSSQDGVLFNKDKTTILKYPEGKKDKEYSIPNSVKTIHSYSFSDCSFLTSLTIPNSVTSIGGNVLWNCPALTSVIFKIEDINKVESFYMPYKVSYLDSGRMNIDKCTLYVPRGKTEEYKNSVWRYFTNIIDPDGIGRIFKNGKFYYELMANNQVRLVRPKSTGYDENEKLTGDIIVPATIEEDGETYTVIETKYPFSKCDKITSIQLPNTITKINKDFAAYCSSLISIEVDKNNPNYSSQDGVLFNKYQTELIKYPTGNKETTKYTIPNSVTTIEYAAFALSKNLTSITIPNSVTKINSWAFAGCTSLTSIVSNIENIGNVTMGWKPFEKVDKEKCTLYVPEGKKEEYKSAEYWKEFTNIVEGIEVGTKFKSGKLWYEITSLGNKEVKVTYHRNDKGEIEEYKGDIIIPETVEYLGETYSVTEIGQEAFEGSNNITSIQIPKTVTSVRNYHGDDLGPTPNFKLISITVDENNPKYSSQDGVLFNKNKTELVWYPAGKKETKYSIPNSVKTIRRAAFAYSQKLTSVTIPNSVKTIQMGAFIWSKKLTSIKVSNSVTTIKEYAFYFCESLISIEVDKDNLNYSSQDGVLFNKDKTRIIQYPAEKKETKYSIPNSVTTIEEGAFVYSQNLTSIKIPNSVTTIQEIAFGGCPNLTSVEIPNSVTTIGRAAFTECTSLTSIISKIENINNITMARRVFDKVNKETCTLYVPKGKIAEYKNAEQWKEFQNIKEIEDRFKVGDRFKNGKLWYEITSVDNQEVKVVENSPTTSPAPARVIKESGYPFTSVVIPSTVEHLQMDFTVTSIGASAFAHSTSLSSVTIPKTITSIEDYAFNSCTSLKSITVKTDNINNITLGNDVFKNVDKTTCTLYVPIDKTETYKNAEQWKEFVNIKEGDSAVRYTKLTNPITIVGKNITISQIAGKNVKLYSITGQVLYNIHATQNNITLSVNKAGTYIVQVGNGVRKVVVR